MTNYRINRSRILTYLLRVVLFFAILASATNAFAAEYSGKTGNVNWVLDTETGELRIYGSGEMGNYKGSWDYGYTGNAPWAETYNNVCTEYVDVCAQYSCGKEEHTHIKWDCYRLICGRNNHKHKDSCYELNCDKEHTHTGDCTCTSFSKKCNKTEKTTLLRFVKTVVIEEGVTSIGAAAFYQCSNLTSISIPNSVTLINYEAFRGCTSLQEINIPASVSGIRDRWTTDCPNLKYVNIDDANNYYSDIQGIVYTKDLSILVRVPDDNPVKQFNMPEGVTALATDAIYKQKHVENVILPTSLGAIKYGNFDYCPNLVSFTVKTCYPPTLEKNIVSSNDTPQIIYLPCNCSVNFDVPPYWKNLKAKFREKFLADVSPYTNDPELGTASVQQLPECTDVDMEAILKETPTAIGVFDHWEIQYYEDGVLKSTTTDAVQQPILNLDVNKNSNSSWKITAYFVPVKRLIEAVKCSDSHKFKVTGTGQYDHGSDVTISASGFPEGYVFDKWKNCDTKSTISTSNPYTFKAESEICLCADIKIGTNKLTVKSSDTNKGTVTPNNCASGCQYTYNTPVEISATPKTGYDFYYWLDGNGNKIYTNNQTINVTSDATYTAYFTKKTYKLTVVPNDPDLGTCTGSATVNYGETASNITATPKNACVEFVKWDDNTTDANHADVTNITENKTLTAIFRKIPYTVSASVNSGNGTATVDGVGSKNADCGSTVTFKASPNYCYHFVKWDDGNTDNPRVVTVTEPKSFTAIFDNSITITANSNNAAMGSVTINDGAVASGGIVSCGSNVKLTATANPCHKFVQWSDGDKNNPRYYYNVTSEVNLIAVFEAVTNLTATASVNNNEGGSVSITEGTNNRGTSATGLDCNTTIVFHAVPDDCYLFEKWIDNNWTQLSTNKDYEVSIADNMSVQAVFSKINTSYTITANATEGGSVMIDGNDNTSVTKSCGQSATLQAVANTCFDFIKWSDESTDNPRTVNVSGNNNYTAQFQIKTFTISATAGANGAVSVKQGGNNVNNTPVNCNSTVVLTATPNSCYTFEGWNDGNKDNPREVTVTESKSFSASFKSNSDFSISCHDYAFLLKDNGTGSASVSFPLPEVTTGSVDSWTLPTGLSVNGGKVTGSLPFGDSNITIEAQNNCAGDATKQCTSKISIMKAVTPCK